MTEMKAMPGQARETVNKFLRLTFHDFYRSNKEKVDEPIRVETREFAAQDWEIIWQCGPEIENGEVKKPSCGQSGRSFLKITSCPNCGSRGIQMTDWIRHLGFRNQDALLNWLIESAPSNVYHSAAFYETPVARHMGEKVWQGAELVFDIDADHISTECKNSHDAWRCNNPDCQETGTGDPPEVGCPKCGKTAFSARSWLCDKCLDVAKEITLRVHDEFLIQDFGIDPDSIQLNFSGHRGYHLRVRDPRVFKLDSRGRVEIAHYITGMGFRVAPVKDESPADRHRVIIVSKEFPLPTRNRSELNVPGWGNRVAEAMIEFIRNIDSYEGTERWVKYFKDNEDNKKIAARNRENAIQGLMRDPPVLSSWVKSVGDKSWQEIAIRAIEAHGGEIDVPVTHDIHRVIRLIGSLHGKTGLLVTALNRDEIEAFNPLSDSLAITDGSLKVRFGDSPLAVPKIRIGDDTLGPFHNESVELPMAAAVFMLCKGVATIE
nr:MAG: hypothetical protein AM324_03265 [Candidatus Thorarchaeota archaeon SMTZ1-83]